MPLHSVLFILPHFHYAIIGRPHTFTIGWDHGGWGAEQEEGRGGKISI